MGSLLSMIAKLAGRMRKVRVVLNVGHSEKQGGATSPIGTSEWQFNKRLVDLVNQFADEAVEFVIVTQSDKMTLSHLPTAINSLNPALVISFHANAFNKETSGSEVLYEDRADLAARFQKAIVEVLNLPDRGIKKLADGDRGYFLIHSCNAPCFILEPFFIDHDSDFQAAQKNIQVLAQKIANTISDMITDEKTSLLKRMY